MIDLTRHVMELILFFGAPACVESWRRLLPVNLTAHLSSYLRLKLAYSSSCSPICYISFPWKTTFQSFLLMRLSVALTVV